MPKRSVDVLTHEDGSLVANVGLTRGARALVEHDDIALVKNHSWYLDEDGYAVSCIGGKNTRMHRLIMDAPDDSRVDHINGDRLDNRRSNLRLCTPLDNCRNRRKSAGCSSKFK